MFSSSSFEAKKAQFHPSITFEVFTRVFENHNFCQQCPKILILSLLERSSHKLQLSCFDQVQSRSIRPLFSHHKFSYNVENSHHNFIYLFINIFTYPHIPPFSPSLPSSQQQEISLSSSFSFLLPFHGGNHLPAGRSRNRD